MLNSFPGLKSGILIIGVLLLTWASLYFKRIVFQRIKKKRIEGKKTLDAYSSHILNKILSISVFFVSLMLILQILGMDIIPLLTVSGIGAAILGFASKDFVANFFGGVMIYITRPFSVDDQIEIPTKSVHGFIEEIGWYLTQVRDLQKKLIFVPNSVFSTEILLNYSRMTHRRIDEKIRLPANEGTIAKTIVENIDSFLKKHPGIDPAEQVNVSVLSISPWGIMLEVKAYTKTVKYQEFMDVKQEVLLKIYQMAYV